MGTITFGRMASTGGKTYVPLDVDVPEGGSVGVAARTTGGHPVPVKLLSPWGRETRVVVLPSLLATVRLTVLVRDAEDFPVEDARLMVRPSVAQVSSSLNQIRHGSELLWYLGLDDHPADGATFMDVERLHSDFESIDFLRGSIELPGDDPAILARPFRDSLIDVFGRPIDAPRLVILRDDIERQSDGSYLRTVNYSQEIPRSVRSLTLWVHPSDHRVPDGFLTLDAPTLAWHRDRDAWKRFDRPDGEHYHDWYVIHGRTSALDLELQRRSPAVSRVSLLVDLDPFDPVGFDETLQSLQSQVHGAWELVGYGNVAPDGLWHWRGPDWRSPDRFGDFVSELPPRTAAEALSRTLGDYVGAIGVGDTLEPDALYRLCRALELVGDDASRAPAMAYADQDLRFDGDEGHGHFVEGLYKTAFDRDLLYAIGATGRPALVARDCIDLDGIASRDASGLAFDLELALAALEAARPILHVPRALYHGRAGEGRWVATETTPERGTVEDVQSLAVLQSHLDRVSIAARVAPDEGAGWGRVVDYEPVGDPLVSIIIPNKDSVPVLRRCIESIVSETTYPLYEVIVVENNSTDPETFAYYESLEDLPTVRVVRYEGPFNFSAICNFGVREAQGSHLLFLNNDTEVLEPRWLELLLGPLCRSDVGAVGARLLYPDDLLQHGGVIVQAEGPLHLEHFAPPAFRAYEGLSSHHAHEATAVTGACLMVAREVFDEVGGFDESLPIAYNDVQLCVSIRDAGYNVVYEPRAVLHHYESYSRGLDLSDRLKEVRLVSEIGETMLRWTELYAAGDPFFDHRYGYHNNFYALCWRPSLFPEED